MSRMVIPKLTETAPVRLPISETKPLIIRAQLSSSTLSEPYFRKLLPEIPATIKFNAVTKIRFNRMIVSAVIMIGLGKFKMAIIKIAASKTIIGIKPVLSGV